MDIDTSQIRIYRTTFQVFRNNGNGGGGGEKISVFLLKLIITKRKRGRYYKQIKSL